MTLPTVTVELAVVCEECGIIGYGMGAESAETAAVFHVGMHAYGDEDTAAALVQRHEVQRREAMMTPDDKEHR